MHTETKHTFPPGDWISGFGADTAYEKMCQRMIIAGVDEWERLGKPTLLFRGWRNVFGVVAASNDAAEKVEAAILAVCRDCSGAMMHAAVSHVLNVTHFGWDKYIVALKKARAKEDRGARCVDT